MAANAAHPSSLAKRTLCRQTPEVGVGCPNRARPVLCRWWGGGGGGALRNERPLYANAAAFHPKPKMCWWPPPTGSIRLVSHSRSGTHISGSNRVIDEVDRGERRH